VDRLISIRSLQQKLVCYNSQPMNHKDLARYFEISVPALLVLLILGAGFGYLLYMNTMLARDVNVLADQNQTLNKNLADLSLNVNDLRAQTVGLSTTVSATQQNLDAVRNQVGGVEQTVNSVTGSVGNLQKLANLDPELLKKYSKVYFMNENYVPAHLSEIAPDYQYNPTKDSQQFLTEASPFLKSMLDAAKAQGVPLFVKSGYRSFAEQQKIKDQYTVTYGAGTANSFSADQGYSEHQLGTTVDFIPAKNGSTKNFDKTQSYQWLLDNAHRFGFVLSYPKNNQYYVFEPWHWRFVGVKLATMLHDNKLEFYAMDQREIDNFLINIFD
jgi:LAS superfamily LD-carboxypeptidase LdcB